IGRLLDRVRRNESRITTPEELVLNVLETPVSDPAFNMLRGAVISTLNKRAEIVPAGRDGWRSPDEASDSKLAEVQRENIELKQRLSEATKRRTEGAEMLKARTLELGD